MGLLRFIARGKQVRGELANKLAWDACSTMTTRGRVSMTTTTTTIAMAPTEAANQLTSEASYAARAVSAISLRFSVSAGELVQ